MRFSQVPIDGTFKYCGVKYKKIHQTKASGGYMDYQNNALRLDNNKLFKLHGSIIVEVD